MSVSQARMDVVTLSLDKGLLWRLVEIHAVAMGDAPRVPHVRPRIVIFVFGVQTT